MVFESCKDIRYFYPTKTINISILFTSWIQKKRYLCSVFNPE